jgi:hypothetical protein
MELTRDAVEFRALAPSGVSSAQAGETTQAAR